MNEEALKQRITELEKLLRELLKCRQVNHVRIRIKEALKP